MGESMQILHRFSSAPAGAPLAPSSEEEKKATSTRSVIQNQTITATDVPIGRCRELKHSDGLFCHVSVEGVCIDTHMKCEISGCEVERRTERRGRRKGRKREGGEERKGRRRRYSP